MKAPFDVSQQNEYRGRFITEFAILERSVDMYLGAYFTNDDSQKTNELIDILIDRIPFGDKRTALKLLVDAKDDADFKAGKHGNKKINHKELLEDIRQFAVYRNYFAHYGLVHSPMPDNIALKLFQHRDKAKVIQITKVDFEHLIQKMEKRRLELIQMRWDCFQKPASLEAQ